MTTKTGRNHTSRTATFSRQERPALHTQPWAEENAKFSLLYTRPLYIVGQHTTCTINPSYLPSMVHESSLSTAMHSHHQPREDFSLIEPSYHRGKYLVPQKQVGYGDTFVITSN